MRGVCNYGYVRTSHLGNSVRRVETRTNKIYMNQMFLKSKVVHSSHKSSDINIFNTFCQKLRDVDLFKLANHGHSNDEAYSDVHDKT